MASSQSDNPASAFDSRLESILELLDEENSQHFIYLTGAAGTGKTTLIERVKDECLLKKNCRCANRSRSFEYWWQHY